MAARTQDLAASMKDHAGASTHSTKGHDPMGTAQREPDHLDQSVPVPTFANTEVAALYQAGKLSRVEADVYDAALTEEQESPYFALIYLVD